MSLALAEGTRTRRADADWGGASDHAVLFAASNDTRNVIEAAQSYSKLATPSARSMDAPLSSKTVEEQLFEALATVKIYTAQVAMKMDRDWRDRLFRQLDSLLDPDEWSTGDTPLTEQSFATFLKLMFSMKPKKRPGLGLSHDGNLLCFWQSGIDRLTIECVGSDLGHWTLSHQVDDVIERSVGMADVRRLPVVLKPFNIAAWIGDGGD